MEMSIMEAKDSVWSAQQDYIVALRNLDMAPYQDPGHILPSDTFLTRWNWRISNKILWRNIDQFDKMDLNEFIVVAVQA